MQVKQCCLILELTNADSWSWNKIITWSIWDFKTWCALTSLESFLSIEHFKEQSIFMKKGARICCSSKAAALCHQLYVEDQFYYYCKLILTHLVMVKIIRSLWFIQVGFYFVNFCQMNWFIDVCRDLSFSGFSWHEPWRQPRQRCWRGSLAWIASCAFMSTPPFYLIATQTALCHGSALNSRKSMFFAQAPVIYQVINTNLPRSHVNNGSQLNFSLLCEKSEPNQPCR